MASEIVETKSEGWSDMAMDIVWPKDPVNRRKRKLQYKSSAVFIIGTALFYKFGRSIADLVYDSEALQEHMKSGII